MPVLLRKVLWILLLTLIPFAAFAGEQQDNRGRLQKIRQRIERATKSLEFQEKQELSLLRDLVALRTSLEEIDRRINKLKREQQSAKKNIAAVNTEIKLGQKDLRSQEHKLKKRLVSLYKEGDSGVLKVLFSSNSPMELAEQYRYLTLILAKDKEMMDAYRNILDHQNLRLEKLQQLQMQQEQRLTAEKNEHEDARSARQLQAQLLSKVRHDKTHLSGELRKLKEKAHRLETLIEKLNSEEKAGVGAGHFAAQKGALPWPLNGALLVGFGRQVSPEFGTLYESHGIEIAASKGTRIKAVAGGKVVFASWFKGYGNLLIVSHTGGYHTLYAQAQSLLKKVGDVVGAGDPLAVAGIPGERGVYFEIRNNGAPANPLEWLKRR